MPTRQNRPAGPIAARCLAMAVAALGPCRPAGAAEGFKIELSTRESMGAGREAGCISGGVPLPRGRFKRDQSFALFRAGGSEIPCQVCPLVVETDGTLRWVLLDFQDDVAAGAANRYTLRAAKPSARPAKPLAIDQTADGITIDTGKLRFAVSGTKPFGLFDSVSAAGKPVVVAGEVSYTQLHGRKGWDDKAKWRMRTFRAAAPETVRLRYAGPLRATIEVAGRFADDPAGAGYKAWLTAWAGKSQVRLKYKLCNSNPDQYTAILVKGSRLALDLARGDGGKGQEVLVGAAQPTPAGREGWIHQGLGLRAGRGAVKAGSGGKVLWTGGSQKDRPGGWIARGKKGGAAVFVWDKLFSTNPARRLAVGREKLVLEPIAERFEAAARGRPAGLPWAAGGFWLYDCSHHSSEYLFDFAAPRDAGALDATAKAAANRLWVLAPGGYYSACDAVGTGQFGTLADEIACYKKWGWTYKPNQVPDRGRPEGGAFVASEDNHYESEADSVQGLLLMYLRTGQRGWFDLGEAWARYHMDLQSWRTDGWKWKDGAIWFPTGGPQGNRQVREKWNFRWGPNWGARKEDPHCADLWRHSQSKSCYCHFYGSGLVDYYCLTGDRDALDAAVDDVEQKDEEFRRAGKLVPGKTAIGSIRGFGRAFEVMMRVMQADPGNPLVKDLCSLCARTLWESPLMDERGFHCSRIGGGFGGMKVKSLSPGVVKWMKEQGIGFTRKGDSVDGLTKGPKTWQVRCMGGTWQHVYVQNGADLYARCFDDEDMRDFVIAFAQMSARYMLSDKCRQTWYYTYFDVPDLGMVFDPWAFDHTDTKDGQGCVHSGWYTRFYPDACARGYSWIGERHLLEKAKEFWYYGSKRRYRTRKLLGAPDEVGMFAAHRPPKDDQVLSASRLFGEWSRPRADDRPPAAVADLRVKLVSPGKAEVRFTAPTDAGGGKVIRYQVKAAALRIAPYEQWDYARDAGRKRNWWRAVNCKGEPAPAAPGTAERFVVTGVPAGRKLHFAVRSFDDSNNRSGMSNPAAW